MLRFYYNKFYKYSNRTIIDLTNDRSFTDIEYVNIDTPDTINGHIIYMLDAGKEVPTYILDLEKNQRWFVSGITPLSAHRKFQISLLRDLVSEGEEWKTETAYVNSGIAKEDNFNKFKTWGLPFTNTKIKEERLNINGRSSYFVFYTNERTVSEEGVITENNLHLKNTAVPEFTSVDYTVSNVNELPSSSYINAGITTYWDNSGTVNVRTNMYFNKAFALLNDKRCFKLSVSLSNKKLSFLGGNKDVSNTISMLGVDTEKMQKNTNNCVTYFSEAVSNWWNNYKNNNSVQITKTDVENLLPYVNKVIKESSTNKVYTLKMTSSPSNFKQVIAKEETGTLRSALASINYPTMTGYSSTFEVDGTYFVDVDTVKTEYNFSLVELGTATSFDFNFLAYTRKLPKSAVRCVNIVSNDTISNEELAQALMLAQGNVMNQETNVGRIIDIQYLPFSVATAINDNIKVSNTSLVAEFLDLDDYTYNVSLPQLANINKETDTIKIVSPSRASQYLFKPYDLGNSLSFKINITLKPYTSIIYIRPQTDNGLLMYNYNDKDGLIISEDTSLTTISNSWAEYVYSNRNYQNAFNRQIQGREFERSWEMKIEQANLKAESWNARNIQSSQIKTYTGNLPLISDIAGAIGTAWKDSGYMNAVQTDLKYNQAMHEEAIDIANDNFSYQIDNIKSQPLVPSQVTTIDCKLLDGVYLEYYSTNPTELNAIENYYKNNGNRIDDYGTFSEYWGKFIKGKIIKSKHYTQPELTELNIRLGMGIYTEEIYG